MKKKEVDTLNSPGFKKILFDFCKAKQAVYNYTPEEFNKKVVIFFNNINKITFKPTKNPFKIFSGLYKPNKKEIVLKFQSEQEFTSEQIQCLLHELNHAWNYIDKKRVGIIPKPIKQLNNPLDFKLIDEILNEAETQVLVSDSLKCQSNKNTNTNAYFHGYKKFEPMFEILCILCNQNGLDFLRSIEGKDIFGIISHISSKMRISEKDVNRKFQEITALISKMNYNIAKYNHKNAIKFLKSQFTKEQDFEFANIEEYVKEPQEIYQIFKEAIEKSGYDEEEKQKIMLKFEFAYDKMLDNLLENDSDKEKVISQAEFDRNNPNARFDFGKIDSEELISSGNYEFVFKTKKESIFSRLLRRKNKLLPTRDNKSESNTDPLQTTFDAKYRVTYTHPEYVESISETHTR